MGRRTNNRLAPLALPGGRDLQSDMKLACQIFEGVVLYNEDVEMAPYPEEDPRRLFVSNTRDTPADVARFAMKLFALCPNSWPCVPWICDAVAQRGDLVMSPQTARRMITGAVFLLLSTEDGEGMNTLSKLSQKRLPNLERLGRGLLQLLSGAQRTPPSPGSTWSSSVSSTAPAHIGPLCAVVPSTPEMCEDGSWESTVGMQHIGWVRGALPKIADAVGSMCGQRQQLQQLQL